MTAAKAAIIGVLTVSPKANTPRANCRVGETYWMKPMRVSVMRFAAAAKHSSGTAVTTPANRSMKVATESGPPKEPAPAACRASEEDESEGRGDERLRRQAREGLEAGLLLDEAVKSEARRQGQRYPGEPCP